MSERRTAALLLAVALIASGCGSFLAEAQGGSAEEAGALAGEFLEALRDGDTDAAWALVYPLNRSAFFDDDRDRFQALVERIDLAGVRWEILDVSAHDGRYRVDVRLGPLQVDDSLGTFVQIIETDGVPTHASITVRIEPLGGSRGVYAG